MEGGRILEAAMNVHTRFRTKNEQRSFLVVFALIAFFLGRRCLHRLEEAKAVLDHSPLLFSRAISG